MLTLTFHALFLILFFSIQQIAKRWDGAEEFETLSYLKSEDQVLGVSQVAQELLQESLEEELVQETRDSF